MRRNMVERWYILQCSTSSSHSTTHSSHALGIWLSVVSPSGRSDSLHGQDMRICMEFILRLFPVVPIWHRRNFSPANDAKDWFNAGDFIRAKLVVIISRVPVTCTSDVSDCTRTIIDMIPGWHRDAVWQSCGHMDSAYYSYDITKTDINPPHEPT